MSKFNAAFIGMSAVSFVFIAHVFTQKNILSESTESLSGSQPNGTKLSPRGQEGSAETVQPAHVPPRAPDFRLEWCSLNVCFGFVVVYDLSSFCRFAMVRHVLVVL